MAQSQIPLTEFGEAIREIYKNPDLPTEVLPESKITPKENEALREKWTKIIFKKNNVGAKKGLSLDDFIELIKEFFGFPAINRSLLDRLIHTGNPARDHYAKEVREDSLKIVSLFTKKYSFDDLLSIGNKVLKERENEFRTYPVGAIASEPKPDIKSDIKPKLEQKPDYNLKSLIKKHIDKYGYKSLVGEDKISCTDLLEILFEDHPKLTLATFLKLPNILGISNDDFIELAKKDIE